MADHLSAAVRRFIDDNLQNVEQLEVLMLLREDASPFWSADAVAAALRLKPDQSADCLEVLSRRGLCDVRLSNELVYRFSPVAPDLATGVQLVADAYSTNRAEVLQLLTSSRRQSLAAFADAFRLTHDRDDG